MILSTWMRMEATKKKLRDPWAMKCLLAWVAQAYLVYALPQVADEAYYQRWGEQLALGYFDHPPGVALWSSWGGRALNLFVLPIAWLLFHKTAIILGSKVSITRYLAAIWCTPLGLASAVLVTPDSPLLLASSIAVWGYAKRSWFICALGISMGMWSKAMMLPAATGILWLWWSDTQESRRRRRLHTILIIFVVCLSYSPHLWWSIKHQGLPWSFQSGRGGRGFSSLDMIAGQLWVGGGLWTVLLLHRYWTYIRSIVERGLCDPSKPKMASFGEKNRRYFWLSAPSFITWLFVSMFTRVEANWTALAWPMAFIWIIDESSLHTYSRAWRFALLVTLPCLALPLVHQSLPLGWGPPRDGEQLRQCVQSVSERYGSPQWIVGRYQEAALLGLPLDADQERIRYLRAHQRRSSHYDLSRSNDHRSLKCPTLWIGPREWVGDRCQKEALISVKGDCEIPLSLCSCRED